ncbi:hypothetical protein F2Q65_17985 [Thiohalocapsa marina]|uniref:DUF2568 domain-containing protein n=1 Tax=Thiohalocapsa marina TaxID=424902 RepID=A0A5M8FNA8_9GAMM|nr:hypothetical protein [Thiohalocapsa marina]KAA6182412.1 hypothetical protein F2Q65_17985 [Thiohalocapsa marina]
MEAFFGPLFHSGRIIDLILLLVIAEAAAIGWLARRRGRGPGLREIGPTLVSGALLMLTIRSALTDQWWGWTALLLTLALVSHIIDLALHWRRANMT